jgi:pyruvate dehydrogenase E2 component (dihydrolipoamide acetyltransferase)
MPSSVIMPKTGMAMEEGRIVRWMKKPGDPVKTGEAIAEIETDKSTMELEAEADGVILAIVHADGETVPVSRVIAWIGAPGEQVPSGAAPASAPAREKAAAAPAAAAAGTTAQLPAEGGKVAATPAARRAAREKGLELSQVPASGRHGEVREADVLRAASQVASGPGGARPAPSAAPAFAPTPPVALADGDTRVPLTTIQKVTGRRMLQSHLEIPPVTIQGKADVTEMLSMREHINTAAGADAKVTVNDMVLRAVARALASHPRVNAVLDGSDVVYRKAIDIGLAVATPQGLVVPVVRGADRLPLAALAARTRELAAKARDKKLGQADFEGGTFTVSNVGMYGVTAFTPIINQPQVAILGVCAIEEELHLVAGAVVSRKVLGLSLTFDHRVLDGAEASVFLKGLKDVLETPLMILV